MKRIESFFTQQEYMLCKARKNKKFLFLCLLPILMGLFGLPSLYRFLSDIIIGNITPQTGIDLSISVVTFLFGWSIPLLVLFLYVSEDIIITNRNIYIKKGISGSLFIIPFEGIAGIEKCEFSPKGFILHFLIVHLLNNKKIKSDTSYSKAGLNITIKALGDNGIKEFDFIKMKSGKYRCPRQDEMLYEKHSINLFVPVISTVLFIIPILMFVFLIIAF